MEGMNVSASTRPMAVPLTDMLRPNFATGEKIALPVANFSPWANFKYVEGVPAGAEGGYSISKLQILDTIIGNLVSMQDKSVLADVPKDTSALSSGQMDSLITDLANKLHAASTAQTPGLSSSIGASFGMAVSQNGLALNILA